MATALMAILALGVAPLFAVGTLANLRAKSQTSLTMLAVQKMEQLKALQWGYEREPDSLGLPVSDLVTNLSECPWTSSVEHCTDLGAGAAAPGNGLNPSPDGALDANVVGYVDYLDRNGNWVGNGTAIPAGAEYVRRWAIQPLPTNPNNTLVFQVRVLTREAVQAGPAGARVAGVTILGVKTRKAS